MAKNDPLGRIALFATGLLSAGLIASIMVTPVNERLGVSPVWAWLLTGLQITGMWLAGRGQRLGWLLGAAAQPAWICYALMSDQFGFIPGCLISAVVQAVNFRRSLPRDGAATAVQPETSGVPLKVAHASDVD